MHPDFIVLSNTLREENLLKTETLFTTRKMHWFADFAEHFRSICAEIVKLQSEFSLPAISRIEYTMLYNNFINRRCVVEVWVYGDNLYLDKNQRMIGEYDISQVFVYFYEFWDRLISARKLYVGKITAQEVAALMIQTLPEFFSYFLNIARFAAVDLMNTEPFTEIIRNGNFKISVGEYMTDTEPIFIESDNKDADKLADLFAERLENEYTFKDYSNLDFSGRSFTYTEFSYSNFRNTSLDNVSLEGSVLIGASFYKATMKNCCLNSCSINEVDFSYATLTNASFVNVRGRAGLPYDKEWHHVGFLPVSFRYADLTNADFSGADVTGADFTGASLMRADFTGATLDDAIFSGAVLRDAVFDDSINKMRVSKD